MKKKGSRPTHKAAPNKPTITVDLNYRLLSIELIEFKTFVEEDFTFPEDNVGVKYKVQFKIVPTFDEKTLAIRVLYDLMSEEKVVLELEVKNVFQVEEMDLLKKYGLFNDKNFIAHLLQLSVSHARGISAHLTKDTVFKKKLIPLLSQEKIHKNYLPTAREIEKG